MSRSSPPLAGIPRPDWRVQFGRRLLLARGRAGLTQQELGAPDLSKSFISLLESGRSYPSVETVIALARRIHSSIGALLLDVPALRLETAQNLVHLAGQMDLGQQGTEAVKLVEAAQTLLPDMPADLRVRVALVRARAAMTGGRLDEAAGWAEEALTQARRHRQATLAGMALALKGDVVLKQRSFKTALPLLEEATATLQRTKSARTEENVRALISLGAARFQLGLTDRAGRAYKRALEVATRLRLQALRGKALMGLGLVARARRQADLAASLLRQAHEAFAQADHVAEAGQVLSALGLVLREQGRHQEALAALEQALQIRERLASPGDRSATLDEIALVHLALGRHADAARAARRAIREAQAAKDRAREAAAQVTLARVLRAQGRRREAVDLLRGAITALMRLGLDQQAKAAAADLGLLLRDAGAQHEAEKYLAMALRKSPAPASGRQAPALEELPH
ncbi:MAG: helix-turn-helix transcriptional regulator [Armatimonadota bacterium]|nr:helix-turn-helix transcriptional regulator [Armatimonadota bacterium]MDR7520331.1 helix-turn-helix transcriptional regulator [Armatimonadota bacterium]MDR7550528.1 helix-turn-helix transcriptional regulator [Armatimonadota bacterium]